MSFAVRVDLARGTAEELQPERLRRVSDGVGARRLAGRARRRVHGRRHDRVRARRAWRPSPAHGTPLEEREPGEDYPLSGFRGSHATSSGAGSAHGDVALRRRGRACATSTSTGPGELEPVAIEGLEHEGAGELEQLEHLDGDRFAAVFNIDGCSWAYETAFDEPGRRLRVERLLVGEGELEGGILHGLHFDTVSRRYALSYCTATDPTQLWVLASSASAEACAEDAGAGARSRARAARRGRGRVVRVPRRPPRLGASVPTVARARPRGPEAARVLRPRRPAEPGAPQLRVVLDAARPDPHARGVRRVRAQRPRVVGLRARVHEEGRPRLGRPRPARPRPRDERGAASATSAWTSHAPASSGARTAAT